MASDFSKTASACYARSLECISLLSVVQGCESMPCQLLACFCRCQSLKVQGLCGGRRVVSEAHAKYCEALRHIWDSYKDRCVPALQDAGSMLHLLSSP